MAKRSRSKKEKNQNMMYYTIIVIALIALGLFLYFRSSESNPLVGKWSGKAQNVETTFEFQDDKTGVLKQGNKKIPFKYEITEKGASATIDGKQYKFSTVDLGVSENGKKISHTPLLQVNIANDDYNYMYTAM